MAILRLIVGLAIVFCLFECSDAACASPIVENAVKVPDFGDKLRYSDYTTVTFYCLLSYTLIGSPQATCQPGGSWTPLPTCYKPKDSCNVTVAKPENGYIITPTTDGKYYNNNRIWYGCNYLYRMLSKQQYVNECVDGNWVKPIPKCHKYDFAPDLRFWRSLSGQAKTLLYSIFGS